MLSETDRAHLARYEAFLNFSAELIRLGDVNAVGRLLADQLKYICNAFSWRYVGVDAIAPNEPQGPPSALFALEAVGETVKAEPVKILSLTKFEQDMWAIGRARTFDSAALDERIATLPHLFRNPEIAELHMHPLWAGQRLDAMFLVSSRGPALDKLDLKFIALTAQFVHRKVSHMRAEQRITNELFNTLDNLRRTQNDLIQSEKLAALGAMVAGVSHEMSTPIANALLMSSSLMEHLRGLDTVLNAAAPRKSDLLRWQGGALEMAQLMERAIQRTVTLLASFKQVAVDQTSERRRNFDLHDSVEDVLATLRPTLKTTPWVIENQIPKGIDCDTFPGPLGQIVTNLVQNAALHAFEGRSEGTVTLNAACTHDQITLTCSDDGKGMDTATLVHIFEPFFTTKLGKGGSGLGLAISYRIATTILAGDLRAISAPGQGTRFILSMPKRTPRKL